MHRQTETDCFRCRQGKRQCSSRFFTHVRHTLLCLSFLETVKAGKEDKRVITISLRQYSSENSFGSIEWQRKSSGKEMIVAFIIQILLVSSLCTNFSRKPLFTQLKKVTSDWFQSYTVEQNAVFCAHVHSLDPVICTRHSDVF